MELKKQTIAATASDGTSVPVTLFELIGDIDGSTAPLAQADILAAAEPGMTMILNTAQVAYLSSAGLRVLLSVYRQVTGQAGRVILVGLAEEIQDTMSVTGFLTFFTTADTMEQAFAALDLSAAAFVAS